MALKAALILVAVLIATYSNSAFAYVGPGAGLSLIGSVIGLLVAVAMALGVVLFCRFASSFAAIVRRPPKRRPR